MPVQREPIACRYVPDPGFKRGRVEHLVDLITSHVPVLALQLEDRKVSPKTLVYWRSHVTHMLVWATPVFELK
jgi:hypothetical protein